LLEGAEAAGRVGAAAATAGILRQDGPQDPSDEGVDGERDQRVDEDEDEDLLQQQQADRRVDPEQELDDRHPHSGEGRGQRSGRHRDELV
jgi:hypothetical protein